jgi:hypothetical protein
MRGTKSQDYIFLGLMTVSICESPTDSKEATLEKFSPPIMRRVAKANAQSRIIMTKKPSFVLCLNRHRPTS